MYTQDIEDPISDNVLIHSIWGQGGLLVEGEVSPDVIRVSKKDPDKIFSTKIATKLKQLILKPDIQTLWHSVTLSLIFKPKTLNFKL